METFVLVCSILFAIKSTVILQSSFKQIKITRNQRIFQFVIATGIATWGFLTYF
jgi:hypothetical protein